MSAGILHNDGRLIYNQLFVGLPALDRGVNLQLRLFTACSDNPRIASTTLAAFTQPTGGGYAAIEMPPSAMTATGVIFSTNTVQTFTANASGYSGGPVLGYFITTTGVTPRIVCSELFNSGPYTMGPFATLNITPQMNLNL